MKTAAKFALLALGLATSATTANASQDDMIWHTNTYKFKPWKDRFCDLRIVDVHHRKPGGPILFRIANHSSNRLRYRIAVKVMRDTHEVAKDSAYVGEANPSQTVETQTDDIKGSLADTVLLLNVEACAQKT